MVVQKKEVPTYTVESKYLLTDDEKNDAGRELGHKEKQLQQIESDRKDRMAAFKAQADEVKAQINELSNKVTLGYEYRKFRCVREFDFRKKLRIFKDVDTGEIRDTKALEPDDYQARLV